MPAETAQPDAPLTAPPPKRSNGGPSRIRGVLGSPTLQSSVSFVAFLLIFLVFTLWLGEKFTNTDARALDIHQSTPVLLLGLAVLVTLIAGQFDLSVASMATLTSFLVVGLSVKQNWPFGLVLVACLAAGAIGGAINGFLVTRIHVNTFIATLGSGGIFLGLSSVYSGGTQITASSGSGHVPGWFAGSGSLGYVGSHFPAPIIWVGLAVAAALIFLSSRRLRPAGIASRSWDIACLVGLVVVAAVLFLLGLTSWVDAVSWTMGVLLIAAVLIWLLIDHTTFGRYLKATGSNANAAALAGVKPDKETFKAFVLGGVLAALAGIILGAGQGGTATPGGAVPFLLPAFAAAFLSTVILSTGRFHVWGTLIGGTFLVWVSQGLIVGGVPFTWTEVVNGAVLILAVSFSTVLRRAN